MWFLNPEFTLGIVTNRQRGRWPVSNKICNVVWPGKKVREGAFKQNIPMIKCPLNGSYPASLVSTTQILAKRQIWVVNYLQEIISNSDINTAAHWFQSRFGFSLWNGCCGFVSLRAEIEYSWHQKARLYISLDAAFPQGSRASRDMLYIASLKFWE